jgi:beta-phosphoglucomutase
MHPKGFLFDFDGVVVDSSESHGAAWKTAFMELFQKNIAPFPRKLSGKSPMVIAAYFCSIIGQEKHTEALFSLKDEHLDRFFKIPKLLPGVHEFTTYLSQHKIPFGIASNATKKFLKNSVQHLNLNFPTVFGVEDYIKPKPAPEAYITLANALGFQTVDFLNIWVFEDSLTGTTAAKLAGMQPIGIATQYSEVELRAAGSIHVFPTLLQAYEYLIE